MSPFRSRTRGSCSIRIGAFADGWSPIRKCSAVHGVDVKTASMDTVESDNDDEQIEDALPDHDNAGAEDDDAAGFERWRKESALGAVGTGIARGLHSVFGAPVDEVVIMAAVPGDPPDADQRVRVILDPDDPTKSVAIMPDTPAEPPRLTPDPHPH
jgi:hypothetical protein